MWRSLLAVARLFALVIFCSASAAAMGLGPAFDQDLLGPERSKGVIVWNHGRSLTVEDSESPTPPLLRMLREGGWEVLRFDRHGKLVQALGKRHWPSLDAPFNHPTAAAEAADGEIYVADGYGNSSVHRFAADGSLIHTWGGQGGGPGAFTTPHAVAVDRRGRVLVGDRENNRVQLFDRAGKYLAEWGDFYHPMQIWIDGRDLVFVTDQIPRISLLTLDGKLVGRCRGAINGAHGLAGDAQGNLYLSELPPQEITKLERLT